MFNLREYLEPDRAKHDAAWFNDILRFIRWNMKPLVSPGEAAKGMSYLLGQQDMIFIKKLFQNTARLNLANESRSELRGRFAQAPNTQPINEDNTLFREMAGVIFQPLPVMEKIRNILISEQKKMGAVLNVRAQDPTSSEDRKRDKALVKNHHSIQAFLHYVYTSIGQKPYSISENESRFGQKPDSGNTQDFHNMGLNPQDPSDVDFFFKNFHKLDQEIAVGDIIEYDMAYNQVLDKIENWTNDAMAKKAIAAQAYVSDISGAKIYNYVAPETVYIYGPGRRKDYNDANAKVIEQRITVRQLLDTIGNAFDIEAHWDNLLIAISYTNGIEFTAIKPSYRNWAGGPGTGGNNNLTDNHGKVYGYNEFMDFKVTLGYVEATSQEEAYKAKTERSDGYYQNNQPEAEYQSRARYETPSYKCYYLAVSALDQVMFKFGVMPYADIEGYNDWNVNFSIITWKEIGDPIAITCIPLIDLINEAWYKFKYEVRRAKPRGTDYNYDSLVAIALDMFADNTSNKADKIDKLIQLLDQQPDGIWTWPVDANGNIVHTSNNQLNIDKPNGLTDKAMLWWKIVIDGIAELYEMHGIAPLRQGDPGNPRDSMNNQFKALEYSEASTYYIPDMLTYILQQLAVKTVFYTQDIVTYKSYDTLAYKFLENAVGADTLDKIETLGKTALHRFGIFIESLNQAPMRAKLDAVLMEAVKTKSIQTSEWLLIQDIKSPKKAVEVFAYFEQRNKKLAQQSAQQLQQQQAQQAMQLEQMKQKTEQIKGDYMIQGKQIDANALIQGHLINQKGQLDKKAMEHSSDIQQIYHVAAADLQKQQALDNSTGKTTFPLTPQQPQGPSPLGAAPPPPPNGAQQLRQEAMPQSSQLQQ